MNKIIISFIVGIILVVGLVWIARPDVQVAGTSATKNLGVLIPQEVDGYDFGTISMGAGNVTHQFKIKNTGKEAVIVNKIYTSCMCTVAFLLIRDEQLGPYGMPGHSSIPKIDQIINPEEEIKVDVVFDPAAHGPAGVGKIQRVVTIENNAGQPVELSFSATVTP